MAAKLLAMSSVPSAKATFEEASAIYYANGTARAACTFVEQHVLPQSSLYCRRAACTAAEQPVLPQSSLYCCRAACTAAEQPVLPNV